MRYKLYLSNPHLLIAFLAAFTLGIAFYAQYYLNIQPCSLCIWERYPYIILLGLSLYGTFKNTSYVWLKRAYVSTLLIGLILTFYHLGIEYHWWQGPKSCSGVRLATSMESFRQNLQARAPVRCDIVTWRILKFSATFWNVVWQSTLLALISIFIHAIPGRKLTSLHTI